MRRGAGPILRRGGSAAQTDELELNLGHLQARRIVAYNGADQRSRPYDMLRTQVLQSMGVSGWKVLGVTSPTPGCGKTLTAINLALSIAQAAGSFGRADRLGSAKAASRGFSRDDACI